MIKAMTRGRNGAQRIFTRGKGHSRGHFLVSRCCALAAESVNRRAETCLEGSSPANMIGMPMRDEDTANTAALCPLCYNGVKIGCIVNRGINYGRAFNAAPHYNSIGTRPGHERGIGGQDDRICRWHTHLLK